MGAPRSMEPTLASSAAFRMVREHWAKTQRLLPVDRDLARAIRNDRALHVAYIARLQAGEPVDRILLAANKPGILRCIRRYRTWETEWADLFDLWPWLDAARVPAW